MMMNRAMTEMNNQPDVKNATMDVSIGTIESALAQIPESGLPNQFFTKKADIHAWLKEKGVTNYTLTKNLIVNVHQSIDISDYHDLRALPVHFGHVEGSFYCRGNNMITLIGCPHTVTGYFSCRNNKLKTLMGGPINVGISYDCGNNELVTLKGMAKNPDSIDCSKNKLINLEYSPEEIDEEFNCSENELVTLKGCPKKVGGNFDCAQNKLTVLDNGPDEVGGSYFCMNNQLTSFQGLTSKIAENLMIFQNPLLESALTDLIDENSIGGDIFMDSLESLHYLSNYHNTEGLIEVSFSQLKKAILSEKLHHKLSIELNADNKETTMESQEVARKMKI
jgi:hypothetical protein